MRNACLQGTIASCGCKGRSTYYPAAALSSLAYGSNGTAPFGSSCGNRASLLNTFLSTPPFYPNPTKSVVVKVVDRCPGTEWCGATESKPNKGGAWLHFDLAWPSVAIPADWFPSNVSFYGYTDFGVWNISYQSVSCIDDWAGGHDPAALGSVDELGSSAYCPADPLAPNKTAAVGAPCTSCSPPPPAIVSPYTPPPSSGNVPDATSGTSPLLPAGGFVIWYAVLLVGSHLAILC